MKHIPVDFAPRHLGPSRLRRRARRPVLSMVGLLVLAVGVALPARSA